VHGAMAAWSPVEDLIAFNSGVALSLIHSDGTALSLLASDVGYVKWMDWSPDGEWLIVADDRGVALFGVHHGGLRLPLAQFLSYGTSCQRPCAAATGSGANSAAVGWRACASPRRPRSTARS